MTETVVVYPWSRVRRDEYRSESPMDLVICKPENGLRNSQSRRSCDAPNKMVYVSCFMRT